MVLIPNEQIIPVENNPHLTEKKKKRYRPKATLATRVKMSNSQSKRDFTYLDEYRKNRWADPNEKAKQAEKTRLLWADPIHRAKRSNKIKITRNTIESKTKTSDITKRMWADPNYRSKTSESVKRSWENPEHKTFRSNIQKKRYEDPIEHIRTAEYVRDARKDPINYEYLLKSRPGGGIWYGAVTYLEYPQYCELFTEEFKERVRAYFGYCCIECGSPQNGRGLCVHHVHYDKKTCCKQGEDIKDKKFVVLCNKCHIITNSNRDYWEQYFSEVIDNYYQGKCYFTKEEMKSLFGSTKPKATKQINIQNDYHTHNKI